MNSKTKHALLTALIIGVFFTALSFVATQSKAPLMIGSLAASSFLAFGFSAAPFSQPKNIIGGHLLGSFFGLLALSVLGNAWWVLPIALGLTALAMLLLDCPHPPAMGNGLIVLTTMNSGQIDWSFLLMPTLFGAALLVATQFLLKKITPLKP